MRKNKTYNRKLTKHQHAKAKRHQIIIISAVIIAAAIIGNQSIKPIFTPDRPASPSTLSGRLPINQDKKNLTVVDKILIAATHANIDTRMAVAIAKCENTNHIPTLRNKTTTATGIFQFTARTWFDYCEGDVKNADDNIACFVKLFPKHPTWWECAKILGYV